MEEAAELADRGTLAGRECSIGMGASFLLWHGERIQ